MTEEQRAELEKLARAATPGDLASADHVGEGSYECPCCGGDGTVEGKTLTNFDGFAIGVQFFGVGNEYANYEAFARAANPATVLDLLATIARLEAEKVKDGEIIEGLLSNLDGLDDYMKQPERGDYGVECAVCMNEWFDKDDRLLMETARARLSSRAKDQSQ